MRRKLLLALANEPQEVHGYHPTMRFAVIARRATATNVCLAAAPWGGVGGSLLPPREASRLLDAGDVALARLGVRRTLDGVERGLDVLPELAERGVLVL